MSLDDAGHPQEETDQICFMTLIAIKVTNATTTPSQSHAVRREIGGLPSGRLRGGTRLL